MIELQRPSHHSFVFWHMLHVAVWSGVKESHAVAKACTRLMDQLRRQCKPFMSRPASATRTLLLLDSPTICASTDTNDASCSCCLSPSAAAAAAAAAAATASGS
jgi:hypothetical protein